MKSKITLPLFALLVAAGLSCLESAKPAVAADGQKVLYYTCAMHPSVRSAQPGGCPICGMTLDPVYGDADATGGAAASPAKPRPYPLDFCIVSGNKLGEMGAPIVFVYTNQGVNQEMKFCCPMCKPTFLKDPDAWLKKMKLAEAAQKK